MIAGRNSFIETNASLSNKNNTFNYFNPSSFNPSGMMAPIIPIANNLTNSGALNS